MWNIINNDFLQEKTNKKPIHGVFITRNLGSDGEKIVKRPPDGP